VDTWEKAKGCNYVLTFKALKTTFIHTWYCWTCGFCIWCCYLIDLTFYNIKVKNKTKKSQISLEFILRGLLTKFKIFDAYQSKKFTMPSRGNLSYWYQTYRLYIFWYDVVSPCAILPYANLPQSICHMSQFAICRFAIRRARTLTLLT